MVRIIFTLNFEKMQGKWVLYVETYPHGHNEYVMITIHLE
jgi:hypothetical protein